MGIGHPESGTGEPEETPMVRKKTCKSLTLGSDGAVLTFQYFCCKFRIDMEMCACVVDFEVEDRHEVSVVSHEVLGRIDVQ